LLQLHPAVEASKPVPDLLSNILIMKHFLVAVIAILLQTLGLSLYAEEAQGETGPDIEHGKAKFKAMCGVCHAVKLTGGPVEGPNLVGVVGREAGSQPDFGKYSEALKGSGLTWSTQTLNEFLVNPMAMVPGTFMPMLIPDDATRADVIAYLASLNSQETSE